MNKHWLLKSVACFLYTQGQSCFDISTVKEKNNFFLTATDQLVIVVLSLEIQESGLVKNAETVALSCECIREPLYTAKGRFT